MSFNNTQNNNVQICESAVDKLRLAMSPSGKIQQSQIQNNNCSVFGGSIDKFDRGYNTNPMVGGANLSLPPLLATLNATSKNIALDLGDKTSTKKGGIKTGLLLDCDDSPRSVFGLHPELTPKIDNINILFGTTNQDSTLKKPTLSKGTDHLRSTEYVCQREKQLYKTELCMLWVEKGFCEFGSQCKFAHNEEERRNVEKHPKFKTKMCRHFIETGTCPFGRRCHFLHGHESPQKPRPSPKPQCQATPNAGRLPIFQTLSQE